MEKIMTNWRRIQLVIALGIMVCFLTDHFIRIFAEIKSFDITIVVTIAVRFVIFAEIILMIYKKVICNNQKFIYKDKVDNRICKIGLLSAVLVLLVLVASKSFPGAFMYSANWFLVIYCGVFSIVIIWDIMRWIHAGNV